MIDMHELRHQALHDRIAPLLTEPIPPTPMLPGCERIDVYVADRWAAVCVDPDNIEIRDIWIADFPYGSGRAIPTKMRKVWAVYYCPADQHADTMIIGYLRENERPLMVPTGEREFLHIQVVP
jgi:hypothetical protein